MKAIRTRILPATNTKPTRIVVEAPYWKKRVWSVNDPMFDGLCLYESIHQKAAEVFLRINTNEDFLLVSGEFGDAHYHTLSRVSRMIIVEGCSNENA